GGRRANGRSVLAATRAWGRGQTFLTGITPAGRIATLTALFAGVGSGGVALDVNAPPVRVRSTILTVRTSSRVAPFATGPIVQVPVAASNAAAGSAETTAMPVNATRTAADVTSAGPLSCASITTVKIAPTGGLMGLA